MIKPRDYGMSLRELQTVLPWTVRYSRDFRANPQPHKDFAHAVVHVTKALGNLAAFVNGMDHDRKLADAAGNAERLGKYVADLVVCALRMANTMPGGVLDLERAVIDRINTKNTPALDANVQGATSATDIKWKDRCFHLADSDEPGHPDLSEQPCSRCGLYYADEARK